MKTTSYYFESNKHRENKNILQIVLNQICGNKKIFSSEIGKNIIKPD